VSRKKSPEAASARTALLPWRIHFFRRHKTNDPGESVPGKAFLLACPDKVRQTMLAVLKAVADAPPPAFSGGGYWEAMHGEMTGYFEVRVDGPARRHFRLFCLLERDGSELGLGGPSPVIVAGKDKPFRTVLSRADYAEVRALGGEFRSRVPRSADP
jgi:hypothetical protein